MKLNRLSLRIKQVRDKLAKQTNAHPDLHSIVPERRQRSAVEIEEARAYLWQTLTAAVPKPCHAAFGLLGSVQYICGAHLWSESAVVLSEPRKP